MELWLDKDKLISKELWENKIDALHTSIKKEIENKEVCINNISEAFLEAVRKRIPKKHFGIFLSGGVDSTMIALAAKKLGADFTCYAVGFTQKNMAYPADLSAAEKAAKILGLKLKTKIYSLEEAETVIKKAASSLKPAGISDVTSISIASVIIAAVELAKHEKINFFIGGLGAEEIFAGYHRHIKANDSQAECWRGLSSMWAVDLVRDFTLAKSLKVDVLTPFLDEHLIKAAMQTPAKYKVKDGERKVILREVAELIGVPKEFAWRKKQAAQYGSNFDKAVEKLAKKHRFTDKNDYLLSIG